MLNGRREFLVQSLGTLSAAALLPELAAAMPGRHSQKVRLAIVGMGRQGRVLTTELGKLEAASIAAFCDTEEARAGWGVRRAEGSATFTDHRAMLDAAKDVDAVIIATPTHLHKQIVIDCLKAGKHVYCEAPIAHTVEDAREMARAAPGGKQVFAVGFEGRSNPIYKLARSFFRTDAVREIVGIESQDFQKTSMRFPGATPEREAAVNWRLDPSVSLGLAGEMGSHALDVAAWYTGKLPVMVRGHGAIRLHKDGRTIADTVSLSYVYEDGYTMESRVSLANSFGGRFEVFRGSNAAIKLSWTHGWMFKEADAPTQGWEVYANRQQFHNEEGITLIADATKLASQGKLKEGVGLPYNSTYYALWDFLESITQNKPAACDAAAGAATTIVAIKAAEAVAKNTQVAIDPALLRL